MPSLNSVTWPLNPVPSFPPPRILPLSVVQPSTPVTAALTMLLETGVSAIPVVDDKRCLLDVYARSDITQLCKGNVYSRLQVRVWG